MNHKILIQHATQYLRRSLVEKLKNILPEKDLSYLELLQRDVELVKFNKIIGVIQNYQICLKET